MINPSITYVANCKPLELIRFTERVTRWALVGARGDLLVFPATPSFSPQFENIINLGSFVVYLPRLSDDAP